MTRTAHIQHIATGGKPPETGYIHHSLLLLKSLIDVPCSVFKKNGSRKYIAYANGTSTQYDYEPYRRRLAGLQTLTDQNALMDLSYSYDNENNITGISNTAGAVNGLGGNYSYQYDYDDMYRLTAAIGSFTDNQQTVFPCTLNMSYSLSGNITGKTVDAMTLQAGATQVYVDYDASYTYNPVRPHAIESISGTNADHAFQWDENGNMTLHNDQTAGFNRILCWDEENRLTAVRDENNMSAYIYDAGGERVWKLTGQVQKMHIDGTGWVDVVDLNNKTLYVSPYLVFNEQGYSKHYYAGAERVSSRIGGGMQDALVDPLNYTVEILSGQDYTVMAGDLEDMLGRNIECTDMPMQYVSMEQLLASIQDSRNHNNFEDNRYIYHSDHLGSSAFLTDANGTPTQHLQYLPFGEPFIEQRSVTDYYTPYTFSAKERDTETGYSYFGARYYNSHISVWLSVDPLSDKYPSMSAYMYCAGNPVNHIDPNGKWIEINVTRYDKKGNIKKWFEVWKRTAHKEVNIIVHNAVLYNGTNTSGDLDGAAADIKASISYYWTDRYPNQQKNRSVSVKIEFPDGITPVSSLDDAEKSGLLITRGRKQSTLFYIADYSVIDDVSNQQDAGGANFYGNLILIGPSSTTLGRNANTILPDNGIDQVAAHELGHAMGIIGHTKDGLMRESCSNCNNNFQAVNILRRSKIVGRGLRNPMFHFQYINSKQENYNNN